MTAELHKYIEPTPWPPVHRPVDLRGAFKNLGVVPGRQRIPGGYRRTIRFEEFEPKDLSNISPRQPMGFLDGIQAVCVAARIDRRDVVACYVAAGAVRDGRILNHEERLALVCSALDTQRVRANCLDVPIVEVGAMLPWQVSLEIDEWVRAARQHVERLAIDSAPVEPGRLLLVDGSLPVDVARSDVIGVVKNAETDYLLDVGMLPTDGGWRSPAFALPAARVNERDRLTAYVRLRTLGPHDAIFSNLIRIEVYADRADAIEVLDAAAATAVMNRGVPSSGDPRWELQIDGMYKAEQRLRSMVPIDIKLCR